LAVQTDIDFDGPFVLSLREVDHRRWDLTEIKVPSISIGEIQLYVSNLERSLHFYQDGLSFRVLNQESGKVSIGVNGRRLLTLIEKPGAVAVRGVTGLYHFAILLPERRSLARLLLHLAENNHELQGAADHGVSEAVYLADPDGNGIELYRDRRKTEWPVDDIGRLQMGTEELDLDDLLMELKDGVDPWNHLPEDTTIGHIHLHVANLKDAEAFYTRTLGLQLMQRYQAGAIFVSGGEYHHHIGLNTWAGVGAPPPPENAIGLRRFELILPDQQTFTEIEARLKGDGVPAEVEENGLLVQDPSKNTILIRAA
jgi:catechol 2,3-dioxygenase